MTKPDLLPDSRTRIPTHSERSPLGNLIPVYCANCGIPWGKVPETEMTFAFVLCTPCADVYGDDAHFYKEPDAVFWNRVAVAQVDEHGHLLTRQELTRELQSPYSPMSLLAREWATTLRTSGKR